MSLSSDAQVDEQHLNCLLTYPSVACAVGPSVNSL